MLQESQMASGAEARVNFFNDKESPLSLDSLSSVMSSKGRIVVEAKGSR